MGSLLASVYYLEHGFLSHGRRKYFCREFWGDTALKFWYGFEGHLGWKGFGLEICHRKECVEFGKKVTLVIIVIIITIMINFFKSPKIII